MYEEERMKMKPVEVQAPQGLLILIKDKTTSDTLSSGSNISVGQATILASITERKAEEEEKMVGAWKGC